MIAQRLEVSNLSMSIGSKTILEDVYLTIEAGETVGLVGESGSGKSMLCRMLLGLHERYGARINSGSIKLGGKDLVDIEERVWRTIRGRQIGFVSQASMSGLNPTMSIGRQFGHLLRVARPSLSRNDAKIAAETMLDEVKITNPSRVLKLRPGELSGGMRQRVMIAASLAHEPMMLIADEPTTALDVTVQAKILELLKEIGDRRGMSMLLVSHDLSVIAEICERVTVMNNTTTVESGPIGQVLTKPQHPYTQTLLAATLYQGVETSLEDDDKTTNEVELIPESCRYLNYCALAKSKGNLSLVCNTRPILRNVNKEHFVACHFVLPSGQQSERNP